MRPLRVALFTGNYNHIRDGVSLTLNRLVGFLQQNGVEVLVFGPTIKNPELNHTGRLVAVPSMPAPGRPEYRVTFSFPREASIELDHFNPDIIHIATPDYLGFRALRRGIRKNRVVVASYHTHFTSYLKYYRLGWLEPAGWFYLRWFYRRCKQVYVPTPSMMETLEQHRIKAEKRLWERGVDTSLFSPEKRSGDWREKAGFEEDDVVVAFVSRLVWEKNLKIYADTLKTAAADNPAVKPLVVGDGPAMEELREMLPEAVFTGFLTGEELAAAYASSDLFLFPSDTETFGNVTLEAMSSGLPCIVADAPGSKSLVDHGENGYLVPVDQPEEFARAVTRLAENEDLRKKMAEHSLKRSKDYTWDQINQKLLSYYREALNQNDKDQTLI